MPTSSWIFPRTVPDVSGRPQFLGIRAHGTRRPSRGRRSFMDRATSSGYDSNTPRKSDVPRMRETPGKPVARPAAKSTRERKVEKSGRLPAIRPRQSLVSSFQVEIKVDSSLPHVKPDLRRALVSTLCAIRSLPILRYIPIPAYVLYTSDNNDNGQRRKHGNSVRANMTIVYRLASG